MSSRIGRHCSRSGCHRKAAMTLTYVYAESIAVVGPLATYSEPHAYDLCEIHGAKLTVPNGWQVIRREINSGESHFESPLMRLSFWTIKPHLNFSKADKFSREEIVEMLEKKKVEKFLNEKNIKHIQGKK